MEPSYLPTELEITEACELIRNEWSEDEHLSRLRPDWRPGEWALSVVASSD